MQSSRARDRSDREHLESQNKHKTDDKGEDAYQQTGQDGGLMNS